MSSDRLEPTCTAAPVQRARRRVAAASLVVALTLMVWILVLRVPFDPAGGPLRLPAPDAVLTSAQVSRGEAYARWARVWSLSSLVVSLLVAGGAGLTRRGRIVADRVVARARGPWWWRTVVTVVVLLALGRVVTLPFAVLLRRRQRAFGLTNQGWAGFAADLVRTEVVQMMATAVVLVVALTLVRRLPRAWPAAVGVTLGTLVMLGSLAYPLVVEPLFNRFTPLPDSPLRSGVLALAERQGVQVDQVLVADASRRTTTLNAYVSGLAGTRRVVLYDNLVDDLPTDEVLSVVAHELTHAQRDDVLTGSLLAALGALAAAGLLGLLWAPRAPGRGSGSRLGWGPGGAGDAEGLGGAGGAAGDVPRLLAVVALATVLVLPVQNAISRRIETRADVGALRATDDPAAFIGLQRQLAGRSLADLETPAIYQWWFGSHPTTRERVALALRDQLDRDQR